MKEVNWPKVDFDHLAVNAKQMVDLEKGMFCDGMSEDSLMEKAGLKIIDWLLERESLLKNGVIVFIGPGHNGGDGSIVARELFLRDVPISFWCPFPIKKTLTNNHINYLTSIGVKKLIKAPQPNSHDLWIDALFGNNQKKLVDMKLISLFNEKYAFDKGKIISIDVPTGLSPDSGKTFGTSAIKANFTLAVGLKKIGLLQDSAIPFVGEIHTIDIGLPINKLNAINQKIFSISNKDVHTICLKNLPKNSSKYKRGRTLLIVGSEKYPGAAFLSVKGAMASGVGYIKALLPEVVGKSIWQVAPEVVLGNYLQTTKDGSSNLYSALKEINLNQFESVLVGPGIGIDIFDWEKSEEFLINFNGLLIVDADGLNRIALSKLGKGFFLERKSETWITPHLGEFNRLFPELNLSNMVDLALKASNQFNLNVMLKGAHSVVANNQNMAWQLYGSDPLCARAGLGDILSGFLSGMSAVDIAAHNKINSESFAKFVLLHSYAASITNGGSNASLIGDQLSRTIREIKKIQML